MTRTPGAMTTGGSRANGKVCEVDKNDSVAICGEQTIMKSTPPATGKPWVETLPVSLFLLSLAT